MAKIVLVVARARNGVIGANGAMPWKLSSDLKRFREVTWGRPLIMGRRTYESIGKVLPGRETIIVTRDLNFTPPEGAHVAHSIDAALALAELRAFALQVGEIMVVGGGEIYKALAKRADELILTEVDLAPEGDAFFPAPDAKIWREIGREGPFKGPKDEAAYTVATYEKIKS
ncbi:MAG: dihydrofolate reductase [Hyphomicrobiales bacterium]|nr:dihydrofolate reductase [Hyphomicrobiales bacterium]